MAPLLIPDPLDAPLCCGGWSSVDGPAAEVVEPATGQVLARVAPAGAQDVRRAAARAGQAQPAWEATGHRERIAVLRRAAALLLEHREEFTRWLVRESGSVRPKAEHEIESVYDELLAAAALPGQPPGLLMPPVPGRTSAAHRVPVGVVGVISPWNVPLVLSLRAVAPALALGNAVVLKPDVRTAVCGGVLVARLFEEAGLPQGVLQVLPGGPDAGEALVDAPEVAMVAFTGSTAVGRVIGERAGRALKRTSLELGGKNPLIVLEDADLDAAARIGAFSSFFHQGQVCMSAGRHVVVESVADAYAERLCAAAKELTVGDPWTEDVHLGPLIDTGQADRVDRIVAESVTAGARLLAGGRDRGPFYLPTVLDEVPRDSRAYREEIFGPVAAVVRVRDETEAVEVANDTEYGLSAAVLSADPRRGADVAGRVRAGMVHVNEPTVEDDAYVPFGGLGASGNGSRHGAPTHWEEFTEWRWVTVRDIAVAPPF
ncbi:benzaldehyde dehydrogenase [Streptomyces sp. NPDC049687]|uniref:benzaldehyde dehydrogenase n=1 Tax=Streptomyces sp. NPDC049687 TaxID=3365596 RepID=UPI00379C9DA1